MQDTLHNTGWGYEYDFIWLYTGYCIFLYSKRIQHRATTAGETDGGTRVRTSPWQAKCKNWAPFFLYVDFSKLFFLRFSEVFGCCFPVIAGFSM